MRHVRVLFTVSITVTILTLIATACGPATTASPTAAPATSAAPAAKAPASIKIGVHGDKTKSASFYTKTALVGIDTAIEEINAAGGVNGAKLEYIFEDDENNPAVGATKVEKFNSENVVMIVSIGSSAVGRQAIKSAEDLKIPIGSSMNAANDLTDPVKKYYFRIAMPDGIASQQLITFLKAKYPKVAIASDGTETGLTVADTWVKTLQAAGIPMVAKEQVNVGATDATAQANKIKAAKPDIVLLVGAAVPELAVYARAHKAVGVGTPIAGSQIIGVPPFDELTKGANDGILVIDATDPNRPETKAIVDKLKKKGGADFRVDSTAIQAYEFVRLISETLKKSGPDRAKFRDALEQTKDWPIAVGAKGSKLTYAPDRHDLFTPNMVVIRKYENGILGSVVWPE